MEQTLTRNSKLLPVFLSLVSFLAFWKNDTYAQSTGVPATITISGPTQVCAGVPAMFAGTSAEGQCDEWVWSGAESISTSTWNGQTDAYITWTNPGTYQLALTAECIGEIGGAISSPKVYKTVAVVAPPPNQFITVDGNAANVTQAGATICPRRYLVLVPPVGATNCQWSSNYSSPTGNSAFTPLSNGRIQVFGQTDANSIEYTLSYNLPNTSVCGLQPLKFTVTTGTESGYARITGNERYGSGSLTLTIEDYKPTYTYTWYEAASGAATVTSAPSGPTFTTPILSQSRSYYLGITTCQEISRQEVPVVIRQVQILVAGAVPTRPVALRYGSGLTLQADPGNRGPYTWLLNGQPVAGATGSQLTVFDAGSYVVRMAGGIGPDYESAPVEVLDALGGQTANDQPLSYVNEVTVLKANVTNPNDLLKLSSAERRQTVTYANGFGQPIQQVAVQAGPSQQDIVQHVSYEGTSSTSQTFLPFPVASPIKASAEYDIDPLSKVNDYYAAKGGQPYSISTAEASPAGRPLEQTQTGTAWAGRSSRISYEGNTVSEVRRWQGLNGTQWYPAGQLSKEILLDPDNRRTEVFKDQMGREILQRKVAVSNGITQTFDTYTVYADAGYVQLVIPPAAIQAMTSSGQWHIQDAAFKDQWLYQYTYDSKARLVERKAPSAAPTRMVYDKFDRTILVQDGNREQQFEWLFTKYDIQNRPVAEGIWIDQRRGDRADVQQWADDFTSSQEFETRTSTGYTTANTYPALQDGYDATLLSLTYYDNYDLDGNGQPDYAYRSQAQLNAADQPVTTTQTRGMTTITRRRVVLPNGQYGDWLTTVLFYDEYDNIIQKQGNNLLQLSENLLDITTLVYRDKGFVPQVLRTIKEQGAYRGLENIVRNRFAYDPAGRLLQTWQQHEVQGNVEPEVLVSNNHYEGLGEQTQKQLHSRDQGAKFLQKVDFAYDLHGQLTHINNSNLLANPENDLFGLELVRDQSFAGSTSRYDGGVSAVKWSAYNPDQQNQPQRERSYRFTYDGLGRLTAATHVARVNLWDSWNLEQGAYDEKDITYDPNGNITGLKRYTQSSVSSPIELIDNLYLYYGPTSGNRLLGVYDYSGSVKGFKPSATGNWTDYAYDANGSITRDGNKGVGYEYNTLNKVAKQTVGSGSIAYTYDASGAVLCKETTTGTVKTEYYVDGFVYEFSPNFSGLRSVPTPEGRAARLEQDAIKLTYEYHLRDHLGNLRVAFRAQATTEELRLSSENPGSEEGPYPKFENVAATQSQATTAYHGNFVAAVTNAQAGPAISVPVSHGDRLQVRVFCKTPYGLQYYRSSAVAPRIAPQVALALAPTVLSTRQQPLPDGRAAAKVAPGIQLSLSGLLSALTSKSTSRRALAAKPGPILLDLLPAYLAWTLLNDKGQPIQSGTQLVPVYTDGQWHQVDLPLDIDLSSEETRNGTLRLREVNEGSNPVFFDLLTITRPQDQVLVSQENHYYPFGMALSGVAVNTISQPQISKDQFNGGSELQDELLGTEQGIYSTFYRSYDPATGRFQGIDPLADKYADSSPYSFSFNDPINFNDPNGDDPIERDGNTFTINWNEVGNYGGSWNSGGMWSPFGSNMEVFYAGASLLDHSGSWGQYGFASSFSSAGQTYASEAHEPIPLREVSIEETQSNPNWLKWRIAEANAPAPSGWTTWLPFIGNFNQAAWELDHGNRKQAALYLGLAAFDLIGGELIGGGIKALPRVSKILLGGSKGRVFYSGEGSVELFQAAQNYAKAKGMTTLEMTVLGRLANGITNTTGLPFGGTVWKALSRGFANGAEKSVTVFHNGVAVGRSGVWGTVEYPALMHKMQKTGSYIEIIFKEHLTIQ